MHAWREGVIFERVYDTPFVLSVLIENASVQDGLLRLNNARVRNTC